MAPPPYLDDAQIERLSALLEQRAVPFRGFNLEALDGFLSALVVSPSPVPPEEWQPLVWGGRAPGWGSPEEAQEVQDLLAGHWNMCAARARQGEDDLPDHLMPLMWLPEDPEDGDEALPEDELDVGREWALGFFEGVGLREEGYQVLKFFPAEQAGGAAYLKSLSSPLAGTLFCPTGGISLSNARDYLSLPNVVCVGGSWVAPKDLVAKGDWAGIEALAAEAAALKG